MKTTLTILITFFIITKSFAQPFIPQGGLVASYGFNGNANDATTNANNGVLAGNIPTLTTDRFNNANAAYQFGGCGNAKWIQVPNSASLQFVKHFSISLWFKQCSFAGMNGYGSCVGNGYNLLYGKAGDGFAAAPGLYSSTYTGTNGAMSVGFNNKLCYGGAAGCSQLSLNGQYACFDTCEWMHVVQVIDSNISRMYLNGEKVDSSIINGPANFSVANTMPLYIGKMDGTWYPFNGVIDDVNIYNKALKQSQIDSLFGGFIDIHNVNFTPVNAKVCSGSNITITASGASTYTWSPASSLNTSVGATVIASPTIATTYTVNYVTASGCAGSVIKKVSLDTIKKSTIVDTICQGSTLLGYNTSGIFKDTFAGANGCDSVRTLKLYVKYCNNCDTSKWVATYNILAGGYYPVNTSLFIDSVNSWAYLSNANTPNGYYWTDFKFKDTMCANFSFFATPITFYSASFCFFVAIFFT
jgi:Concanavalin A-like lectin/glucanases superfamily